MAADSSTFHDFEHRGWQTAAAEYDRRFGELTSQSAASLFDAVGAAPGLRLLDVACGPGYVAALAARRGCSVVAVDFSSAMAEKARAANPEIDVREGDAENLEFPDESFDAVVMNFGMLHLEHPERAISEAFRVLRRGGRYAFTVWDVPERAVGFGMILHAIQTHGRMDVPLPAGPPFFRFSEPEESRKTLTLAGFVNVQTIQIPQTWIVDSGEEILTTFRTAAVRTAALLHAQTAKALKKIGEELVANAEVQRRDGRLALPMPAILTSGLRP